MTTEKKYKTISVNPDAKARLLRYKAVHHPDRSLKDIVEEWIYKLEI